MFLIRLLLQILNRAEQVKPVCKGDFFLTEYSPSLLRDFSPCHMLDCGLTKLSGRLTFLYSMTAWFLIWPVNFLLAWWRVIKHYKVSTHAGFQTASWKWEASEDFPTREPEDFPSPFSFFFPAAQLPPKVTEAQKHLCEAWWLVTETFGTYGKIWSSFKNWSSFFWKKRWGDRSHLFLP